ncbi:MAG TPA: hypothetical protein VJO33_15790 [Gemmatimonadaceae bacterium]|nr:hypothetical protein [Gemmatimonadaceae bacterium]
MVNSSGRSSLGCLLALLIVAVAMYFGVNLGEAYWRFYEFQDAMAQEVRFANQIPDDRIKLHLSALADSLGLPEEATEITINRTKNDISVSAEYTERVQIPLYARQIRFNPRAQGRL